MYDLPHRSSLNLLKKTKILPKIRSVEGVSQKQLPLMYLRSPKHFKAGKQILFYFNKQLYYKYYFSLINTSFILKSTRILFNLFKNYSPRFYVNEFFLRRVSITVTISVKF